MTQQLRGRLFELCNFFNPKTWGKGGSLRAMKAAGPDVGLQEEASDVGSSPRPSLPTAALRARHWSYSVFHSRWWLLHITALWKGSNVTAHMFFYFYSYTLFKGYTPFTVITKCWLYSPYCATRPCSLFYARWFTAPAPLHAASLPGDRWLVLCESASFRLQSLVYCIF